MRIGIDLRMAGTGEGIGRYCEELLKALSRIDFENTYFLITISANSQFLIELIPNKNFKYQIVQVSSPYYSWQEQTRFIRELKKLKLDLVHFPNFNVPIFYPGRFIITIHDIIHHYFPGKKKARFFHRLAYKWIINSAVRRAEKIIAVSETTKKEIVRVFRIESSKIEVVLEGVDETYFRELEGSQVENIKQKYSITKPYLLFVGVWRQYKNLERLARAFDILKERWGQDYQLVLAGKIDPFYPEIKNQVLSIKNQADVLPLGYVPDEDLLALYQGASLFVLPSLVEGFGLIGIEAQAAGLPVVASDIPVLKEVLNEAAVYFNPKDEEDMAHKLNLIFSDQDLRVKLAGQGKINAKKYNWQGAAKRTLEIYQSL